MRSNVAMAPYLRFTARAMVDLMLRITHRHQVPVAGLSGSIGFDTDSIVKSIVNAVAPAIADKMPMLVGAAWPEVEGRLPGLVDQLVPQAVDKAWPMVKAKVPDLVTSAIPLVVEQAPRIVDAALPPLKSKVLPMVRVEADVLLKKYLTEYMGPLAPYQKYILPLTLVLSCVTVFAAGITIYKFASGE